MEAIFGSTIWKMVQLGIAIGFPSEQKSVQIGPPA
jgi:hypothetical protein